METNDVNDEDYVEDSSIDSYDSDIENDNRVITSDLEFIANFAVDEINVNTSSETDHIIEPSDSEVIANSEDSVLNERERSEENDSSDSSSDSDSSEDVKRFIDQTDMLDEEDDDMPIGPLRTKNEIIEQVEEPIDIVIRDDDELFRAGKVLSCVSEDSRTCTILIQSEGYGNILMLKEGSAICLENRTVLGKVHEIFGPVTSPFYIIRCNISYLEQKISSSASYNEGIDSSVTFPIISQLQDPSVEIGSENSITVKKISSSWILPSGSIVYAVKRLSETLTFDALHQLKAVSKGCDASNANDEEIPEDEQEFSDDEKEQVKKKAAKDSLRMTHENSIDKGYKMASSGIESNIHDQIPCGLTNHRGRGNKRLRAGHNTSNQMNSGNSYTQQSHSYTNQSYGHHTSQTHQYNAGQFPNHDSYQQPVNIYPSQGSYSVPSIFQLASPQTQPSSPMIMAQQYPQPAYSQMYTHQQTLPPPPPPSSSYSSSNLLVQPMASSQNLPWPGFGTYEQNRQHQGQGQGQGQISSKPFGHIASQFVPSVSQLKSTSIPHSNPIPPNLPVYTYKPIPKKQ